MKVTFEQRHSFETNKYGHCFIYGINLITDGGLYSLFQWTCRSLLLQKKELIQA